MSHPRPACLFQLRWRVDYCDFPFSDAQRDAVLQTVGEAPGVGSRMTDLSDLVSCTFSFRPSTEVRGWMCQDRCVRPPPVRARLRAYAGCGYACDDETRREGAA
jgi:hypothetical protein